MHIEVFLNNMRFKTNTISNTHHNYIFLDVEEMINITFACAEEDNNNINYSDTTIGKEMVECCLNNKSCLDSLVVYDDTDDEFTKLLSLNNFSGDLYQRVEDLVCE